MVAVKQNLILKASSYSQKILRARVWAPKPVYRSQKPPGYGPVHTTLKPKQRPLHQNPSLKRS